MLPETNGRPLLNTIAEANKVKNKARFYAYIFSSTPIMVAKRKMKKILFWWRKNNEKDFCNLNKLPLLILLTRGSRDESICLISTLFLIIVFYFNNQKKALRKFNSFFLAKNFFQADFKARQSQRCIFKLLLFPDVSNFKRYFQMILTRKKITKIFYEILSEWRIMFIENF